MLYLSAYSVYLTEYLTINLVGYFFCFVFNTFFCIFEKTKNTNMFDLIQLELARQGEKAEIIYLFSKAIKYVYKVTHDGTQTGEQLIKKLKIRNCYEYGHELPESIKQNLRICKSL